MPFELYPAREYCALISLTMDRKVNGYIVRVAILYSERIFSDNRFIDKDGGFIISAGVKIVWR
jgi:hypothetical protein